MKKILAILIFMSVNIYGMQDYATKSIVLKTNTSGFVNKKNVKTKRNISYANIRNKLFSAIKKQSVQELEKLQKYKITPHDLNTSLIFSIIHHSHSSAEVVEWLLEKGGNPEIKDPLGHTLLINAFKRGFLKVVEVLLKYRANPDAENILGDTLMIRAFNDRNLKLMEILLDHGAKKYMLELLMTAIKNNDLEIANLLLQYKVDINQTDRNGMTPIMIAEQKNKTMMNLLLKHSPTK